MTDFIAARRNMVDCQLRPNKVVDATLLDAVDRLPRETFVPGALSDVAYIDEDISIGGGRYLMEPTVLCRMLQALEVTSGDIVLDVGCATGYDAAVLALLGATVVALESDAGLAAQAGENLIELGIDNAAVVTGPLDLGWRGHAPYDAIFFSGAVVSVPQAILDQLADGGRLAAVCLDGATATGTAALYLRTHDTISRRALFDAAAPLLPGFGRAESFVF